MATEAGPASATKLAPGGTPGKQGPKGVGEDKKNASQGRWAAWLLAPTVVALGIVIVYPIISAIVMSFQKDAGLDPVTGLFAPGGPAGLQNYVNWVLQQCASPNGGSVACPPGTLGGQFWTATGTTFFFTVVTVALETVLGFWMAIIMARTFKGRSLIRAAVLVPWAIPTAVTAKLWLFIFDYEGIANNLFNVSILWTGSEWPAKWAVIIADTWKTTPFMALLILAGLQMIPADVYEAAKVDGTTTWQRFRLITLPLVKPALMVAILFRTLDALRMFDLPYILTQGANNTTTLSILVINQIRQGFNAAAALSTITFVIIFLVAFIFVRFLGANVVEQSGAPSKGKKK
ncbi:Trehalose transport system permease protein SugA [Arthrobacter ulcerisalmonis]|uniref:Trehalose transport system permease protein SugA n=1 Tax=Arthrobacter ulcerisalmonis TaxID=2483813 RepID=A0A3P5WRS4_9MICC|nr:sugar ABC transporter permease [Arthrobacter ulcerisalmonis]VDC18684.1 Trehalose transport system permease protein SugA [Arthrobacter ulcerisalmonis]